MEYEKIKQLMDDMGNSKLTSLDIEFPDGVKIKMEKRPAKAQDAIEIQQNVEIDDTAKNTNNDRANETEEGYIVKSPMVGTFYLKPSPDSAPYVEKGKKVKKQDVLCIIEAMKLMNEIESEYEGVIEQIYLHDGDTVEYGTPLFKIV